MNAPLHKCVVTTPRGFERVLFEEITGLVDEEVSFQESPGALHLSLSDASLARVCMGSRLANRVMIELLRIEGSSAAAIYQAALDYPWERIFEGARGASNLQSLWIRATQRGEVAQLHQRSLRLKDAIADRCREQTGERPSVGKEEGLHLNLHVDRAGASVFVNASRGPLQRRGRSIERHDASLNENLAAGLLMRLGWPSGFDAPEGATFVDPMCGAGTILVEAGEMYFGRAPNVEREDWCLSYLPDMRTPSFQATWDACRTALEAIHAQRLESAGPLRLVAGDISSRAIGIARSNLKRADLSASLKRRDFAETLGTVEGAPAGKVLILANAPYGERLGERVELLLLHRRFGRALTPLLEGGASAGTLLGSEELAHAVGLKPASSREIAQAKLRPRFVVWSDRTTTKGPEDADALRNRITKNLKKVRAWAKEQQSNAYRIYDRDIPGYASSVDTLGEYLLVKEYAPPKSAEVKDSVIVQRRVDTLEALKDTLDIPSERVVLQVREAGKRSELREAPTVFSIEERGLEFEMRLGHRHDAGLFLDHAPLRSWIAKEVRHRVKSGRAPSLLNLFAYTCSIGVYAAHAGGRTLNVDMSKESLQWGEENYRRNRLGKGRHRFVQSDCRIFLRDCTERFDLITLDPPTFSNSKRSDQDFDVTKDHPWFVERCLSLLKPGGILYFSNNAKKFRLAEALTKYSPQDLSKESLPPGFREGAHRLWRFDAPTGEKA